MVLRNPPHTTTSEVGSNTALRLVRIGDTPFTSSVRGCVGCHDGEASSRSIIFATVDPHMRRRVRYPNSGNNGSNTEVTAKESYSAPGPGQTRLQANDAVFHLTLTPASGVVKKSVASFMRCTRG